MKAVVSITIDEEFVVHDIKVIEGEKGLFIAMPSRKAADGEYRDIAHPINSETREQIQKLILENLLGIYSIHQRIFLQKFQLLSRRKTRDRLLAYFSMTALDKGSPRFTVPFTHQEMADYLCVERSAMCAEMSAMQKEGILRFKGREFELLHAPEAEHQD